MNNIFISIGLFALVVAFTTIFLVYYQVNIIVQTVRQDLYYASNNAILSFDVQDLSYRKYTVNMAQAKETIESLLNKNYTQSGGSIKKIQITNLDTKYEQDKVNLDVEVQVTFRSVINLVGENEHKFKLNENIKISLLKYE